MSLTHFQLKRLIDEIKPRIIKGRVQKIHQPEDYCLEIAVYARNEKNILKLRTAPGSASCYLSRERTGAGGEAATDFCMKLRKNLDGLKLQGIEQVENDRIVAFCFGRGGGDEGLSCRLVAELFSTAGNLFLLDRDNRVLAVMTPVAARSRDNYPGTIYEPPAPRGNAGPAAYLKTDDPLERMTAERELGSYNEAVCLYYEHLALAGRLEEGKKPVRKALAGERKRVARLVEIHGKTISESAAADRYREDGEILSANFLALRRGQESIHLPDLYAGNMLAMRYIQLDPSLTPQKNVERYFRKYKKLKKGGEFAGSQLEELKARLSELGKITDRLDKAGSLEEIEEVRDLARRAGAAPKTNGPAAKGGTQAARLPFRSFEAADGSTIMVGRGGRDNDKLTFHVAKGRDLWFHISGGAGAHVVLNCPREGGYTEEAMLDAAHLAVLYSSLKNEPFADVDYTYRKNLKKPKGLAPGKVLLSARKTIRIKVEKHRLDRLLGRGRRR